MVEIAAQATHIACNLTQAVVRRVARTVVHLNFATREFHAAADAIWFELIAGDRAIDRNDYIATLTRVYGFEAPVEAALAYTPDSARIVDLPRRFRSGLLAEDLLRLGIRPSELSRIPQCMIAPFSTPAEAMGWLYVHERFTLIHDSVYRQLQVRLPQDRDATSYLRAYEGSVGALWDELGLALDRIAHTDELQSTMESAAREAFRLAVDWYGGKPTQDRTA